MSAVRWAGKGRGVGGFWRRLSRPRRLLVLLVGVVALLGASAVAAYLWADRQSARQHAEATAIHLARLLSSQVAHSLDVATLLTVGISDASEGVPPSREAVRAAAAAFAQIDTIVLVDDRGRVVSDLAARLAPGLVISDRQWVRAALTGESVDAEVAPAAADPVGGGPALVVARPLVRSGQGLSGAVAATIPLAYFDALRADLAGEPPPAFGLIREDGTPLLRLPAAGLSLAGAPPERLAAALAHAPAGLYWQGAGEDLHLVSYRTLPGWGLVAWVSMGAADVMAAWAERALVIGLSGALAAAVLGALGLLLSRALRTERQAAAALRTANQELSRSNADLEQFAYVASHDLKEPLRNIASYVQLLQRRYQGRLDEDADAFIGYTVDGVRRMQVIINELLVYSRIGTGPLSRDLVQSGVLVSAALANLKTVIGEAGAAIDVAGPLPVVLGDAGQLASVFQNLIGNALKYRREDVRPEVVISAAALGGHWEFQVADNGIGIDPQYHTQIFDLFKRLHARDRYGGSGIGLAVCQRVVERHGGRIWVTSSPGRGAVFHFTLPQS